MAKIERFEDLNVWKDGMQLCKEVYALTNTELFSKDFGLRDQIRRSAISVPSNISEGYERDSVKQFIYFLVIAKGPCGEVRTQFHLAHILGYIDDENNKSLQQKCVAICQQIAGFVKYLKNFDSKR